MKKVITLFLIFILILSLESICLASTTEVDAILNREIKVTYNDAMQEFQNVNGVKVFPLSYEGTTYLPIRSISSLFSSKIKWDGNTNSIYLGEGDLDTTSSKTVSSFTKGNNETINALLNRDIRIYFNNKVQTFTDVTGKVVYPLSYNGTTYLPVRAVSNLFGLKIDWDGFQNTILISSKENNNLNTNIIKIEVNSKELIVALENNQATKELIQKLNSDNVVVKASEYGGFEKVGSLGFSLTREDKQIKTEAGDIVLYQGNQISLFYNSNSWSYTKLGKVTNMSANELKNVLGSGDVTLTIKK